jgi:hypothetical protein
MQVWGGVHDEHGVCAGVSEAAQDDGLLVAVLVLDRELPRVAT